jgi:hypothetical protein
MSGGRSCEQRNDGRHSRTAAPRRLLQRGRLCQRVQGNGQLDGFVSSVPDAPTFFLSSHPNPFNPSTTIRFELPEAGPVRLSVIDVAGRLVRALVDDSMPQGSRVTGNQVTATMSRVGESWAQSIVTVIQISDPTQPLAVLSARPLPKLRSGSTRHPLSPTVRRWAKRPN